MISRFGERVGVQFGRHRLMVRTTCVAVCVVLARLFHCGGSATAGETNFVLRIGPGGCLEIPWTADLPGDGGFTVEAWVHAPGGSANRATVLAQGTREHPAFWRLGWQSPPIGVELRGSDGTQVKMADAVDADHWIHVATTYDGTNVAHYLNGVRWQATPVRLTGLFASGVPIVVGRDSVASPGGQLIGFVDEVRIWSVARSDAEIRAGMWDRILQKEFLVLRYGFDNGELRDSTGRGGNGVRSGDCEVVGVPVPDPPRLAAVRLDRFGRFSASLQGGRGASWALEAWEGTGAWRQAALVVFSAEDEVLLADDRTWVPPRFQFYRVRHWSP